MKFNVLVVEDERAIREGFRRNLEKIEQFTVFDAENDAEARRIIGCETIHGLLLDIQLPGQSGLEFLDSLTERTKSGIVTYIITGYDLFDYVQEALRQGVSDYVLKPLTPDKITALGERLLSKMEERFAWNERYAVLLREVEEGKPLIRERFIQDLVSGKIEKSGFESKCKFLDIKTEGEYYRIAIIQFGVEGEEREFQARLRHAYIRIEDMLKEKKGTTLFSFGTFSFVLLDSSETGCGDDDLYFVLDRTTREFKKDGIPVPRIAFGGWVRGPEQIFRSYLQANHVLVRTDLFTDDFCFSYTDVNGDEAMPAGKDDKPDITALLGRGDALQVNDLLEQETARLLSGTVNTEESTPYDAFLPFIQAVTANSRWFGLNIGGELASSLATVFDSIKLKSFFEVKTQLSRLINAVAAGIEKSKVTRYGKTIAELKEYILSHLQEPLSQAKLAVRFGYTPNYLGFLFKRETGISLSEYINQEKVEKAKKLLTETNMLVSEVASSVGFNDQYYFSTVFKKITGLSPSVFRDSK